MLGSSRRGVARVSSWHPKVLPHDHLPCNYIAVVVVVCLCVLWLCVAVVGCGCVLWLCVVVVCYGSVFVVVCL